MAKNNDKAPFGIVIAGQLKPGATLRARGIAQTIAGAHKAAANGNKFWTYTTAVGAGNRFYVFAPFQDHSQLGSFTHDQAMGTSSSAGNADELLTQIEETLQGTQRSIVEYLPAYSNHPTDEGAAPGPYLFCVAFKIRPGKTLRAKELAAKIAEGHKQGSGGLKFWVYGTTVGTGGEYFVVIPFNSYADIDGWGSAGQSLGGASDADALLGEFDSLISESNRMILEYVPDCSNPA